ncbi:hypothetical protein Anapl_05836 [Anas platyrhynchos]|uniref:Uncharacterized protein n=1 Tax=Anas platyrhynchos TaxID=8839 RepID=R0L3S6_ANAPL|nr:hypothetical protein Anapl_05836 [Anas platyrhynchos]
MLPPQQGPVSAVGAVGQLPLSPFPARLWAQSDTGCLRKQSSGNCGSESGAVPGRGETCEHPGMGLGPGQPGSCSRCERGPGGLRGAAEHIQTSRSYREGIWRCLAPPGGQRPAAAVKQEAPLTAQQGFWQRVEQLGRHYVGSSVRTCFVTMVLLSVENDRFDPTTAVKVRVPTAGA